MTGCRTAALGGKEWQRAGGTLSDTTARKEFGLTQAEILRAVREGKLQFRRTSIYAPRVCDCSVERSRRSSAGSTAPPT